MSVSRRIAFNTATTWVTSLLSAIVALALVPFLQWRLGLEGFGLSVVVGTLVGIAMMADLGLRGALSRHLAAGFASQEIDHVNSLFSAAMCCFVVIGGVLMAIFFFAAPWIVLWFDVSASDMPQAVALVRYYAPLETLLWFFIPTYAGVLEGNHRFDLVSLVHAIEVVTRGLAVVLLVGFTDLGLVGWAIGMFGSKVISLTALVVLAHRVWPSLSVRPRFVSRQSFVQLLTLGGLVFLYWNVFRLSVLSDPLVIGSLLGPVAVALYEPGTRAVWAWNPFVAGLIRQLIPLAAGMHATGRSAQLSELLVSGTRLTLLMAIPFLVTLGCFAEPVIRLLWLGEGREVTAQVVTLWVLAEFIDYAGGPQWHILLGMNRVRFIVAVEFCIALANLACSILLVYQFREWGWGNQSVLGAAIPTVFFRAVVRSIITVHTTRMTNTPLAILMRQGFLGPMIVLVVLLALALTLRFTVQPDTPAALIACLVVPPLAWFPLCWFCGFQGEDRWRIARLARQLLAHRGRSA